MGSGAPQGRHRLARPGSSRKKAGSGGKKATTPAMGVVALDERKARLLNEQRPRGLALAGLGQTHHVEAGAQVLLLAQRERVEPGTERSDLPRGDLPAAHVVHA